MHCWIFPVDSQSTPLLYQTFGSIAANNLQSKNQFEIARWYYKTNNHVCYNPQLQHRIVDVYFVWCNLKDKCVLISDCDVCIDYAWSLGKL